MKWSRRPFGIREADARAELHRHQVGFGRSISQTERQLAKAQALNAELRGYLQLLAEAVARLEAEEAAALRPTDPAAVEPDGDPALAALRQSLNECRTLRRRIAGGVWELLTPLLKPGPGESRSPNPLEGGPGWPNGRI